MCDRNDTPQSGVVFDNETPVLTNAGERREECNSPVVNSDLEGGSQDFGWNVVNINRHDAGMCSSGIK
jgi:hypothetical protein